MPREARPDRTCAFAQVTELAAPTALIEGHGVGAPLAMIQVSTTELKSRLGTYLALVRAGETIDITSHSRSVARLVPSVQEESAIEDPTDPPETLRDLDRLPSGRSIPVVAALLTERRRR